MRVRKGLFSAALSRIILFKKYRKTTMVILVYSRK